jgi:F0F1-type ATP synthase assembly protein I
MAIGAQLAIKALISGTLIAVASEVARRNPGWGGLIASLPLTSLIALAWLWRDTADPVRAADFMAGTALYVIAALPAFALIAVLLRRGAGIGPALLGGALAAMAGYLALMWLGKRWGLPV